VNDSTEETTWLFQVGKTVKLRGSFSLFSMRGVLIPIQKPLPPDFQEKEF
jgi:hypothetical protein